MIRIHITWPLVFVLALGLLLWIVREPKQTQRRPAPRPSAPPHPRSTQRQPASRRPPLIITQAETQDGSDDQHDITFEEALRRTDLTPEEIAEIGDREAFQHGKRAYDQAGDEGRTHFEYLTSKLRTRRPAHV